MTDEHPVDPSRDAAEFRGDAPKILPVIMCGGSGTRLWPASRDSMPKQFIPLLEEMSNFQVTAKRFSHPAFSKPLVLASNNVCFIVAEQLQAVGVEAEIALEPMRRDSAAAVAVAACLVERREPGTVGILVAADHPICDMNAFVASCMAAAEEARAGFVMTLGVTPVPHTSRGTGTAKPWWPVPTPASRRSGRNTSARKVAMQRDPRRSCSAGLSGRSGSRAQPMRVPSTTTSRLPQRSCAAQILRSS